MCVHMYVAPQLSRLIKSLLTKTSKQYTEIHQTKLNIENQCWCVCADLSVNPPTVTYNSEYEGTRFPVVRSWCQCCQHHKRQKGTVLCQRYISSCCLGLKSAHIKAERILHLSMYLFLFVILQLLLLLVKMIS